MAPRTQDSLRDCRICGLYPEDQLACINQSNSVAFPQGLLWRRSCDQSGQRDGHQLGIPWKSFPSLTKRASYRRRKHCCPHPRFLFPCESMILGVVAAVLQPWGKKLAKWQERGSRGQEKPCPGWHHWVITSNWDARLLFSEVIKSWSKPHRVTFVYRCTLHNTPQHRNTRTWSRFWKAQGWKLNLGLLPN